MKFEEVRRLDAIIAAHLLRDEIRVETNREVRDTAITREGETLEHAGVLRLVVATRAEETLVRAKTVRRMRRRISTRRVENAAATARADRVRLRSAVAVEDAVASGEGGG